LVVGIINKEEKEMKWTFEILKSNNIDGTESYCACATLDDDVYEGCVESRWYDSREVAESVLTEFKNELK
jgi:hypothetical protein